MTLWRPLCLGIVVAVVLAFAVSSRPVAVPSRALLAAAPPPPSQIYWPPAGYPQDLARAPLFGATTTGAAAGSSLRLLGLMRAPVQKALIAVGGGEPAWITYAEPADGVTLLSVAADAVTVSTGAGEQTLRLHPSGEKARELAAN